MASADTADAAHSPVVIPFPGILCAGPATHCPTCLLPTTATVTEFNSLFEARMPKDKAESFRKDYNARAGQLAESGFIMRPVFCTAHCGAIVTCTSCQKYPPGGVNEAQIVHAMSVCPKPGPGLGEHMLKAAKRLGFADAALVPDELVHLTPMTTPADWFRGMAAALAVLLWSEFAQSDNRGRARAARLACAHYCPDLPLEELNKKDGPWLGKARRLPEGVQYVRMAKLAGKCAALEPMFVDGGVRNLAMPFSFTCPVPHKVPQELFEEACHYLLWAVMPITRGTPVERIIGLVLPPAAVQAIPRACVSTTRLLCGDRGNVDIVLAPGAEPLNMAEIDAALAELKKDKEAPAVPQPIIAPDTRIPSPWVSLTCFQPKDAIAACRTVEPIADKACVCALCTAEGGTPLLDISTMPEMPPKELWDEPPHMWNRLLHDATKAIVACPADNAERRAELARAISGILMQAHNSHTFSAADMTRWLRCDIVVGALKRVVRASFAAVWMAIRYDVMVKPSAEMKQHGLNMLQQMLILELSISTLAEEAKAHFPHMANAFLEEAASLRIVRHTCECALDISAEPSGETVDTDTFINALMWLSCGRETALFRSDATMAYVVHSIMRRSEAVLPPAFVASATPST